MPVQIETLTTEVTVSEEELRLTKRQIEMLTAAVLDRLQQQRIDREKVQHIMSIPRGARPPVSFRE